MNRFTTTLLSTALILGITTPVASASVLNNLVEANRRRGGIEFTERQGRTSNPAVLVSSVLNDLVETNRRWGGSETDFNDRRLLSTDSQQVASVLTDLLEDNRQRGGSETQFEERHTA